jgi:hypothetical protein
MLAKTGSRRIEQAQMSDSARSFAVVCEARADQETACLLVDCVLLHHIEWMQGSPLELHRRWCGTTLADTFLIWTDVRAEADKKRFKPHGRFNGQPGKPDAHRARLALFVLNDSSKVPDAVLFIRDSDNDPSRREGLQQAIDEEDWPFPVVIGLAHTKRECWVINGFSPKNKTEEERLADLRRQLSFDPCKEAERLVDTQKGALRDAKRVLRALSEGDHQREQDCLREPLERLVQMGKETGLAEFIKEIESKIVSFWK